MKRSYQTDLTDAEWKALKPHVPAANKRGRPRIHSPREILDAVFYVLRSGCPWRLLPREFPPWETVYSWFRKWSMDGTFERLNAALREQLRSPPGQESSPERGHRRLPDDQEHRGGRRTERLQRPQEGSRQEAPHPRGHRGLLLKAKVHSAKVPDQDGLRLLLESARIGLSRLRHLWLDAGYEGRGRRWAEEVMGLSVEVVRKPPKPVPEQVAKVWAEEWAREGKKIDWQRLMPPRGYVALPRRWVVERTFSWLGQNRRMSKDYERLCASAEAFIYAAMIRLMVRRLARA